MTFAHARPTVAIPGPSPVPDRVLRAMHRPSPDIYGDELVGLSAAMTEGLKRLAGTRANVAPYIGNGHSAWEATNTNIFSRGDKALVLSTGHFALGWAKNCEALGVDVEVMDFGTRAGVDPQRLADRLRADRAGEIRAVLVCQVDTASTTRNDIPAIRQAMGDHPALLAVDCIAALGCEPFFMDDWGVDVMISASQKGLMVPPGLSFVWFQDRARRAGDLRTPYWDWTGRAEAVEPWQYWFGTPPVQHIYGLTEALAMLEEEGLAAVWARHEGLARATWAAFDTWGQDSAIALNVSEPAFRARAVTMAHLPRAEELRAWTKAKAAVTLGIGISTVPPEDHLRVAHMGHAGAHMLLGTLAVMEAGMVALDIPHGPGALDAAARAIAGAA